MLCAVAFVWTTGRPLPDLVASHFQASGVAAGFMPRAVYMRFMLAIVILLPGALVVLPRLSMCGVNPRLNLPNREYWMAPIRRADTIEFVRRQSLRFGSLLLLFLCYAHWLVVRANAASPPSLSSPWFVSGLVVFMVVSLGWVIALSTRFRNLSS